MKKNVWLLGVAVAALTSCTQSEVLDVPESKLIGFETHVDKPTRALATDVLTANLNGFYVYADYGTGVVNDMDGFTPVVANYLKNEKAYKVGNDWKYASKPWVANHVFRFAAYSDGATTADNVKTDGFIADANVTYSNSIPQTKLESYGVTGQELTDNIGTWGLEFTDYAVTTKDLIAAVPFPVNPGDLNVAPEKVNVTFKHLLAKVVFEISKSGGTEEDYVSVDPFNFTARSQGDCLVHFGQKVDETSSAAAFATAYVTDPHIHWNVDDVNTRYDIFPLEEGVKKTWNDGTIRQEFYVLPQSNAGIILSDFKIYIQNSAGSVTKSYIMDDVPLEIPGHTKWLPGQIYRYYATIAPGSYNIEFSASVDAWHDTANRDHNISPAR